MPYGDTGYIEQGYANVAALPYEMQLMDVQSKRNALEQSRITTGRMQRSEMDEIREKQEAEQYTAFSPTVNGDPEELANYTKEQGFGDNSIIRRMVEGQEFHDGRSLRMTRNKAQSVQDEETIRVGEFEEENREQIEKNRQNTLNTESAAADELVREVRERKAEDLSTRSQSIATSLYSIGGQLPSKGDYQKKAVSLFMDWSKGDDSQQDAAISLANLSNSLGAISHMEEARRGMIGEHDQFLSGYVQQMRLKEGEFMARVMNPDGRKELMAEISANMKLKGASADERDRFEEFSSALANHTKVATEAKELIAKYTKTLDTIYELRKQPETPDTQREMKDMIAVLTTESSSIAGHVQTNTTKLSEQLKLQSGQRAIQRERQKLLFERESHDLTKQKANDSQRYSLAMQQMANLNSNRQWTVYYTSIVDDPAVMEKMQLDPDASPEQNIRKLQQQQLLTGSSSVGGGGGSGYGGIDMPEME